VKPKVVWITHWAPGGEPAFGSPWRCGTAAYAESVLSRLMDDIDLMVLPIWTQPHEIANTDFDVLHLNFAEGAPKDLWMPYLVSASVKKVLTLHDTMPEGNRSLFTDLFDAVIVNQRVEEQAPNFRYIPQFGIIEVPFVDRFDKTFRIGTHGWPLPYKMIPEICRAAVEIGDCELLFLMSESAHADVYQLCNSYSEILQGKVPLILVADWLPPEEVVRQLQTCSIGVFGCSVAKGGQSSSVMSAIAAHIPVVVNDNWLYADIRDYTYVADFNDPKKLAETMRLAHEERRIFPTEFIEERGADKIARRHLNVYKEVLG